MQRIGIILCGFVVIFSVLFFHVILLDEGRMRVSANLPNEILAEQRKGVVTVVEFMDFYCGSCQVQVQFEVRVTSFFFPA